MNEEGTCVCDEGYTTKFCSLAAEELDDIIDTKLDVLTQIGNSVASLGEDLQPQMVLDSIADISKDEVMNTDESILKVEEVL